MFKGAIVYHTAAWTQFTAVYTGEKSCYDRRKLRSAAERRGSRCAEVKGWSGRKSLEHSGLRDFPRRMQRPVFAAPEGGGMQPSRRLDAQGKKKKFLKH